MISNRIKSIEESSTLAMAKKSRDLTAKGKKIINLSLGEPDFNTPTFIKDAAKKAIEQNYSKYTPVPGYNELRKVISEKFKRDNNLNYSPAQIICSTGAKQSLMQLFLSILNPRDEIIICAPYWVSYYQMIKFAKAKPIIIKSSLENSFKIQPEDLKKKLSKKTKAFLINSPCNPSGAVYSKNELKELASILKKHPNTIVISDEIYEHINFTGNRNYSIGEFLSTKNQVVTINGLSKGFAMTGWRLGYLGAPIDIANACNKIQGQFTSGTCSITQRAAIIALSKKPVFTQKMNIEFQSRRDMVIKYLAKVPGLKFKIPDGAFYVFIDFSFYFKKYFHKKQLKNNDDLSMFLLQHAEVATVSGSAFGNKKCIRISIASSKSELKVAMNRIQEVLKKLT